MILTGRFTTARRAHLPSKGPWPAMAGAGRATWRNIGVSHHWKRDRDIPSREVARGKWAKEQVLVHCARDVIELILTAGNPSAECRRWCLRFMKDYSFAAREVRAALSETN
jgi:hypothetical protein